MDLSQINDIQKLKALAYDQLVIKEQAENNLAVIQQRIAQIARQHNKSPTPPKTPND